MTWDTIFRAGTHVASDGRSRYWSMEDLDLLAAHFDAGENIPVVIHHPSDQNKAVQFGHIAGLNRFKDKLLARYKDVPEVLKKAVKEGLMLAKSVSIDPVKMKIRHLGLLGANQPPAVDGLGAVNFTAVKDQDKSFLTYMFNYDKKEKSMDPKDEKIKALEDKVKVLEEERAGESTKAEFAAIEGKLEQEKKAHAATKEEFVKYKQEQEDNVLKARVDALVESGRVLPCDREKELGFARALPGEEKTMEFTASSGKKEKISPREMYLKDLEKRPADKDGLLSEFAGSDGRKGDAANSADDETVKDINSYA